ncbi:MAG TPA: 1,4-dihydroxy-6-naphthoate synthase [Bacteroidia bacterium]|nr:1,4-dihydroxy-6-naphthoate synthase [Bacteroidia bacterium]
MKQISIGFSPCPNDTFIFDALVNGRIDTGEFKFNPVLADVEELNRMALVGKLDVTKISIGAYAAASSHYVILDSGSALGKGVGPLLVSKNFIGKNRFSSIRIAIPGKHTTANLLLSIFFPEITDKTEVLFSDIENKVLMGEFDAGLLIHEGRFTYAHKGLTKLFDLGEVWESKMHVPLPLGCIAARRSMDEPTRKQISELIQSSLRFANANPSIGKPYILEHSQEMAPEVIESHINLYVNEFSVNLGPEGRSAIEFLLNNGTNSGLLTQITEPIFNSIKL